MSEEVNRYSEIIFAALIAYGPRLILAIIVLFVGMYLIKVALRGVGSVMESRNIDPTLKPFLKSIIGILFRILLIISVASMIGIETTSFIAVLGAAGLAVGLALQGSLANFAGGILILIFKPFKVGDVIQAQGHIGSIREILILYTIMKTGDNKTIIIPNGKLSNDSIVNFSIEPFRRVDLVFGISYTDNIEKAKGIIHKVIEADERISTELPPLVVVSELADSSVNITVRVWSEASNYWPLLFALTEKVKITFDEGGISIPFPQRDVHLYNQTIEK